MLGLLLAADGEHAVRQRDVDVLLLESREFGRDLEFLIRLGHVHHRREGRGPELGPIAETAEASCEILEQPIDFAAKVHIRAEATRGRSGGSLPDWYVGLHGMISLCCRQFPDGVLTVT